jgi:hypothetical protein
MARVVLEKGAEMGSAERALKKAGQSRTPVDSGVISESAPTNEKPPFLTQEGRFRGAEHRTRTGDLNLGKVAGD